MLCLSCYSKRSTERHRETNKKSIRLSKSETYHLDYYIWKVIVEFQWTGVYVFCASPHLMSSATHKKRLQRRTSAFYNNDENVMQRCIIPHWCLSPAVLTYTRRSVHFLDHLFPAYSQWTAGALTGTVFILPVYACNLELRSFIVAVTNANLRLTISYGRTRFTAIVKRI